MIDVTPLLPLCDKTIARRALAQLPSNHRPDKMFVGVLGVCSFVVTLDGDGDCEASIYAPFGQPSESSVAAFFAKWGRPIPAAKPTVISGGRGLHWVVSRGVRQ